MDLHQDTRRGPADAARRVLRRDHELGVRQPAAPMAMKRATRYLRTVAGGITSDCSFDPGFVAAAPLPALRAAVRTRFGVDIGFDAGSELFSSMISLRSLAPVQRPELAPLRGAVAERFAARHWRRRYRMFAAQGGFAADTDCTGVALAGLYEAGELDRGALLQGGAQLLRSAAGPGAGLRPGVMMVYWEDGEEPQVALRGKKQDPAVACNALHALKLAAREGLRDPDGVIEATTAYVESHLVSGEYAQGTRYYPSPDSFLYFASQLCGRFVDCRQRLASGLAAAIRRRDALPGRPGHPDDPGAALNTALRVLAGRQLGLAEDHRSQVARLSRMQGPNGAWPACTFFSLGKLPVFFGSAALTTMFAIAAVTAAR